MNEKMFLKLSKKSYFVSVLLTFFFGPLGLFYNSTPFAIFFIVASIVFAFITMGVGSFLVWPFAVLLGCFLTHSHNKKLHKALVE